MRLIYYMQLNNLREQCRLKSNNTYSFNLHVNGKANAVIKHTLKHNVLVIKSNFKQDRKYTYT